MHCFSVSLQRKQKIFKNEKTKEINSKKSTTLGDFELYTLFFSSSYSSSHTSAAAADAVC